MEYICQCPCSTKQHLCSVHDVANLQSPLIWILGESILTSQGRLICSPQLNDQHFLNSVGQTMGYPVLVESRNVLVSIDGRCARQALKQRDYVISWYEIDYTSQVFSRVYPHPLASSAGPWASWCQPGSRSWPGWLRGQLRWWWTRRILFNL